MAEWRDIPEADYHRLARVGSTSLDLFARSRPAFRDGARTAPTAATTAGTLAHWAVLEPWRLEADACIGPVNEKTGKHYGRDTQAWQQFAEENPGKIVVAAWELEAAVEVREALSRCAEAQRLVDRCLVREASVLWTDARSGVECKSRPDAIDDGESIMLDLKTTGGDYGTFIRQALRPTYLGGTLAPGRVARQFGHYTSGAGGPTEWRCAVLLVVREPSIEAGVIWVTEPTVQKAASWCSDQLLEIAACRSGEIPWSSEWSRWPHTYDEEEGLNAINEEPPFAAEDATT